MNPIQRFAKSVRRYSMLNTLIVGVSLVLIWRGIWGLIDYYFPNHDPVVYIICILVGIIFIYVDDLKIDEIREK